MKKFIVTIILVFCAFIINAQDISRTTELRKSDNWKKYSFRSTDNLDGTTYDSLSLVVKVNKPGDHKFYARTKFDTVGGADTTMVVQLKGKKYDQETTYTTLKTGITSAIGSAAYKEINWVPNRYTFGSDSVSTADTVAVYRYFQLLYIISGDDNTGTGVSLENVEIWTPEFDY